MTWLLFEDFRPVLVAGLAIEAVLLYLLFQSGRGFLIWVMGGVGLVVALVVAADFLVVTDREMVEQTMHEARDAINANNPQQLATLIADPAMRQRAIAELSQIHVREARITKLEVKLNPLTSPPTAIANFSARVTIDEPQSLRNDFFGRFSVELEEREGRWLMVDYEYREMGEEKLTP